MPSYQGYQASTYKRPGLYSLLPLTSFLVED